MNVLVKNEIMIVGFATEIYLYPDAFANLITPGATGFIICYNQSIIWFNCFSGGVKKGLV